MTARVKWIAQRNASAGDFIGNAFLRLLDPSSGDSSVSEPELLVRESAQNSWDARKTDLKTPVEMSFHVVTLDKGGRTHAAFAKFFEGCPALAKGRRAKAGDLPELARRLQSERLVVLHVRDVGTWGLGGPVDASVAVSEPGSNRYVKFMLNVGDANTNVEAGGAFGLGRSVFWRMSECRTVVVYSRCKVGRSIESRLVGLTLTDGFELGGINYTGRHWWTDTEAGRPMVGTDADDWARRLGIEEYGSDETGTTVLVVAPWCPAGSDDLAQAIARSIELHLWPKYVDVPERDPRATMDFSVSVDGSDVEVRGREQLAGTVLASYVNCFTRLHRLERERSKEAESESIVKSSPLRYEFRKNSHPRNLGRLVMTVDASAVGAPADVDVEDDEHAFAPVISARIALLANHVALLRTPELVVCYKKVPRTLNLPERLVGVFKSSTEANEYFRRSEDSSHGSWSSARMKTDGVVVDKFNKTLEKQITTWYQTAPTEVGGGTGKLAIGQVANALGEWFSALGRGVGGGTWTDDDDDVGRGRGGGGGRRVRGKVTIQSRGVQVDKGRRVNVWEVVVDHPGSGVVALGLREADEDGGLMPIVDVSPGGLPALLDVSSDSEFSTAGSDSPKKRLDFDVGPTTPNVTDVSIRVRGHDTTTLTVRGSFDEGTTPVLEADLVVDGGRP